MLRKTLMTLSASALLAAALGAANDALAFPFGPPPGPPPGFGGPPPSIGGPPPGLAGAPPGLNSPPAGLSGPPRGFVGPHVGAGVHGSAARGSPSRLGGGYAGYRSGQSARFGSASGHSASRYRQWGRYGVYGAASGGYGYGSNGDAYGDTDCSYVYRYSHGAYRRVAVCSEN